MSERSEIRLFCSDIDEAVERILQYTSEMTYGEFIDDTRTQDAVMRNLEILGEAGELPRPSGRGFLLHGQYLHHRDVM